MRINVRDRAIGEDQTDVESNERAAPAIHEAHKAADVAVFLDAVAIVDPDKRKVLHVMKNFEQRNADQNCRDQIIAVPPKRDARDQQSYLHGVGSIADYPKAAEMRDKQDGNG